MYVWSRPVLSDLKWTEEEADDKSTRRDSFTLGSEEVVSYAKTGFCKDDIQCLLVLDRPQVSATLEIEVLAEDEYNMEQWFHVPWHHV